MSEIRERATEMMPSVVLTLLSMIQALALELLWSRVIGSPHLWRGDLETWIGWLQVFVLALGFLQVWLYHVSMVLRFRWTPQVRDAVFPFVIGVFEFALIELCEPARLGPWMLLLAGISAFAMAINQSSFKAARAHPDNREFFDRLGPAGWSDFMPALVALGVLFVFGLWLSWAWHPVPSVLSLCVATLFFGRQLQTTWQYWHFTFDPPAPAEKDRASRGPVDRESLES